MKKKWISLFMVAVCMLVFLTGCGQTESEQEMQTEKTNTQDAETENANPEKSIAENVNTDETETGNANADETETEGTIAEDTIVVASLKGPTSMGLVGLMDKAEKKETEASYEFVMETAADTILPMVLKGEVDIALIPANVASVLHNRALETAAESDIVVIDINTLGVLYLVTGREDISTMKDLAGKTIYLTGKGTTPEYVLNYLLAENQVEDVTLEYKSEATEVAAVLKENPEAIGLLPQPFVTAACTQNEALSVVLDLNEEWTALQGESGSSLVTGVTIARKAFVEEHSELVKQFMTEHKESIAYVNANPKEAAALVVKAGIVEKEAIAEKAIPNCNLAYLDGEDMKQALAGYLEVLYNQNPDSVGGVLPQEEFYYE
ncbi:MAG: ABC transporter substrate-binding protein [Lachnospiraceae bacterium]|nr:ABC transporter substrate-binding protein [Lachnospiraceae bacterium]